jgi:FkbM family methyltransferase
VTENPVINELLQQRDVLTSYWRRPRAGYVAPVEVLEDDNLITRVVRSGRPWESWLTPLIVRWSDPTKVSLDIGANVGSHTVTLAQHSRTVHAFEPMPDTFAVLSRNAARFPNIVTHQVAASNAPGTAHLIRSSRNYGAAYIGDDAPGLDITCVRIDDLTFDAPVGFIKIDVEGHERQALEGCRETLVRDRPVLILEDTTHSRVLLKELGYRCKRISLYDYLCTPART